MQNPLLDLTFPVPFDAIRAEHIEPAVRKRLSEAHAAIDAIAASTGPFSYESTLGALERASENLEVVMSLVEHLEGVSTTPDLRTAYNAVLPDVSAFGSSIPLNPGLWRVLNEFSKTREAQELEPIRRRLLDNTLADFRRSGAQLDDEKKARLKAIDRELSAITTRFSQQVLDATNEFELLIEDEAALAGLPDSAKAAARDSAEQKDKRAIVSRCKRRASFPCSRTRRTQRSASGSGALKAPSLPKASTTIGHSWPRSWRSAERRQTCSASVILPTSSSTTEWPRRARTHNAS